MRQPRILVGVTTYEGKDYIFEECIRAIKRFDYPKELIDLVIVDNSAKDTYFRTLKRRGHKRLERVLRGANSREALTKAQNRIRQIMLAGDYEYLLFIESDLICPPDTVKRLLSHDKPVVGSVYNIARDEKFVPCIFVNFRNDDGFLGTRPLGVKHVDGKKYYDGSEIQEFFAKSSGLEQIHGVGFGCTLIERAIVERFPFWCDERFDDKHSDVYFYLDLQNNNIPVFVDTSVNLPHYPSDWGQVRDK